jgi:glycine cleavage system H protein
MDVRADLRYTKEHAWVRAGEGTAVAGITDHAQKELGDVVFVELPAAGAAVVRGRPYGVVESVKAVSDLVAPLTGVVAAVNADLARTPELVNREPYGRGWTIEIAPADPAELAGLMDAERYGSFLAEIGQR